MSPTETLKATIKQDPLGVIIISEQRDGSLGLTTGPDMKLEHIAFLLDQAKHYIISRSITPTISLGNLGEQSL